LISQIARNNLARIINERNLLAVRPERTSQLPARVEAAASEARIIALGSLDGPNGLNLVQTFYVSSGRPSPGNNFQSVHRAALL
jgi:hypothetical protein